MGQIRFSLRKDIDPISYGKVSVDEIRGEPRSGDDILLLAKKFMADPEPYKIATVLTASQAADIRRSFAQPQGVWRRREITQKVRAKIATKVPQCVQQRVLSREAGAYLTSWADGTLPRIPRPRRYAFLTHRICGADPPGPNLGWGPRHRERHIDLSFDVDDEADSASDDAYQPILDEDDGD